MEVARGLFFFVDNIFVDNINTAVQAELIKTAQKSGRKYNM